MLWNEVVSNRYSYTKLVHKESEIPDQPINNIKFFLNKKNVANILRSQNIHWKNNKIKSSSIIILCPIYFLRLRQHPGTEQHYYIFWRQILYATCITNNGEVKKKNNSYKLTRICIVLSCIKNRNHYLT